MKNPIPYNQALPLAEAFLGSISDCCDRVVIAGSLRRKKDMVGDIEIVAIPKYVDDGVDLLGDRQQHSLLDSALLQYRRIKGKDHQRQYLLESTEQYGEVAVDLFITTPECWGCILAIRTGSADFSHWLVTHKSGGGACPGWLNFRDGRLITNQGQVVETPEELDVFKALRLDWIAPEQRAEGRWRR